MTRGSRQHLWLCWGVVAGSQVATHVALGFDEFSRRTSASPPGWTIGVAVAGAALILAAALSRRGRARFRVRPRLSRPSSHGHAYLEGFALREIVSASLVATFVLVSWESLRALEVWTTVGQIRIVDLISLLYVFAVARAVRTPLAEFGLRRGRGVLVELGVGIVAGVAAWLLFVPTILTQSASEPLLPPHTVALSGIVFLGPLLEELLYRGLLLRHLRDHLRWWPALLICTAVFTLNHSVSGMPTALLLGLACGLLREWRGSLIAPVAAHMCWNLLSTAAAGHLTG